MFNHYGFLHLLRMDTRIRTLSKFRLDCCSLTNSEGDTSTYPHTLDFVRGWSQSIPWLLTHTQLYTRKCTRAGTMTHRPIDIVSFLCIPKHLAVRTTVRRCRHKIWTRLIDLVTFGWTFFYLRLLTTVPFSDQQSLLTMRLLVMGNRCQPRQAQTTLEGL